MTNYTVRQLDQAIDRARERVKREQAQLKRMEAIRASLLEPDADPALD
jgi:ribosomal 50S subunit-associated protein YjgA (DUF615 family)